MMREQTLVSSLTTRFTIVKLALGRIPIFTRRSRTITTQIVSARLSKNGPTVCLGYFSSSTHSDRVIRLAQMAWRQCVLVFVHDLGFCGRKCMGRLANTGLVLSTGNRYLFLLQRLRIPFNASSLVLIHFSHAWRQSFVIEVYDLYSSFVIDVVNRYLLMNISMSYNSKTVLT